MFALGSLAAFAASAGQIYRSGTVLLLLSALLALAASGSSPTTILFVLAPPLWSLIALAIHRSARKLGISLILTAWPLAVKAIMGRNSFHYANAEGWTDFSVSNLFANIGNAFKVFIDPALSGDWLILKAYLLLAILLVAAAGLAFAYRNSTGEPDATDAYDFGWLIFLMACALVGGGIVLGPSLVVTHFLQRYPWPAYLFGALFLALPLVCLAGRASLSTGVSVTALLAAMVLNGMTTIERRDADYLPYL